MPLRANGDKLISLFRGIFECEEQMQRFTEILDEVIGNSKVDGNYQTYRYQIFKRLVKIVKNVDELSEIIRFHDQILKSVSMDSEEDITGYHHDYCPKNVFDWIRISGNVKEFLSIVRSRSPLLQAKKVAERIVKTIGKPKENGSNHR